MRKPQDQQLIGDSPAFLEVLEHVSLVAPLNRPVLVIGERGTGKELIASRIHFLSGRWDKPLVKMNCAALTESLLETELFGHEAGSFTGAAKRRLGRFEQANHGSLFLDELSSTSSGVQEKILRVIEYGEFERVGGSETIRTNVRIIGATNEDLPTLSKQGKFRADLLDRLAFDVITLPPLRERPSDIMTLAEHFAVKMTVELGKDIFNGFSEQAKIVLMNYRWPGNIRELKNVIERAVISSPGARLRLDAALAGARPGAAASAVAARSAPEQEQGEFVTDAEFRQLEKANIIAALVHANGKTWGSEGAAELLGVKPSTLAYRMKVLEIRKTDV